MVCIRKEGGGSGGDEYKERRWRKEGGEYNRKGGKGKEEVSRRNGEGGKKEVSIIGNEVEERRR